MKFGIEWKCSGRVHEEMAAQRWARWRSKRWVSLESMGTHVRSAGSWKREWGIWRVENEQVRWKSKGPRYVDDATDQSEARIDDQAESIRELTRWLDWPEYTK